MTLRRGVRSPAGIDSLLILLALVVRVYQDVIGFKIPATKVDLNSIIYWVECRTPAINVDDIAGSRAFAVDVLKGTHPRPRVGVGGGGHEGDEDGLVLHDLNCEIGVTLEDL